MSDPNSDMLLDALRRVGVRIPDVKLTLSKQTTPFEDRKYWHVSCGAFDTMIDQRDTATHDGALTEALNPLQPWYVRKISFAETPHVEEANRDAYVEWLRRGVK